MPCRAFGALNRQADHFKQSIFLPWSHHPAQCSIDVSQVSQHKAEYAKRQLGAGLHMQHCSGCKGRFRSLATHLGMSTKCPSATAYKQGKHNHGKDDNHDVVKPVKAANRPYEEDRQDDPAYEIKRHKLNTLAELRYKKVIAGIHVNDFKKVAEEWHRVELERLADQVARAATSEQAAELLRGAPRLFEGIHSEYFETRQLQQHIGTVEPVRRVLDAATGEAVADLPFTESLQRLLLDEEFAEAFLKGSARYKGGYTPATVISDNSDGVAYREHPVYETGRGEADEVGGVFITHDDVQLNNPLGTARGLHSVGGFFSTFTNLPAKARFNHRCVASPSQEKPTTGCKA